MSEYTTIEKVENYIGFDIEASFQAQVLEWIEYVSDYIELYTGRIFAVGSTTSIKIYEVKKQRSVDVAGCHFNPREFEVDEMVNTSKIGVVLTIDDEEIDSDDFLLYPINTTPKNRIVLTKDSGLVFTEGEQNISVEAVFGYSEDTPKGIEFAATVLATGIIQNNLSTEGELQSVTLGRYTMTFKDEKQLKDFERVKEILNLYSKPAI